MLTFKKVEVRMCLLLFAVCSLMLRCDAQEMSAEFIYPNIPTMGDSASVFVPDGWIEYGRIEMDLNADHARDLVLAIQYQDSAAHYRTDSMVSYCRPRVLVVALSSESGVLRRISTNNDFLLREDEGGMAAPELMLESIGDTLKVGFQFLRGSSIYSFVLRDSELVCVRCEHSSVIGGSELWVTNIDLVMNIAEQWHGSVSSEHLARDPDVIIPDHGPITLGSLKQAMTTEIAPGVFL